MDVLGVSGTPFGLQSAWLQPLALHILDFRCLLRWRVGFRVFALQLGTFVHGRVVVVILLVLLQLGRLYKPSARKPWLIGLPRACTYV